MHLFTLFMEVILIRILEIGMHLFTLFLEVKTNKDKKIRDRDASLNSFHGIEDYKQDRNSRDGNGKHLRTLFMGVKIIKQDWTIIDGMRHLTLFIGPTRNVIFGIGMNLFTLSLCVRRLSRIGI
jgi:hypothetical protein